MEVNVVYTMGKIMSIAYREATKTATREAITGAMKPTLISCESQTLGQRHRAIYTGV